MYVPACETRHINKTLAVCKGLEFAQTYCQRLHIYIKYTDIKGTVTRMQQLHHSKGQKSKQS